MFSLLKRHTVLFILLSVFSATILGIIFPNFFLKINFLGEIFLNFLKLFALPLICSALIVSLGNMGKNLSELKTLSRNILGYMLISEVLAVSIALLLFNVFSPGTGVDPTLILNGQPYNPSTTSALNLSNFFLSIFPHNIFAELASFNLLPVVIFSILIGIGCACIGDTAAPIIRLTTAIREVSNICLHGVMLFSPIGIFSLVGNGVAQSALHGQLTHGFLALFSFVVLLVIGLLLHGLWQFIMVIVLTKQPPLTVLKKSIPMFSTAFATSSSVASLPAAIATADSLKAAPNVTRFMLPLCASINIGGMMLYEVAAVLFFSQMLVGHLPLSHQILIAIACILGGMAEGGIPETSMVSLVMTFKMVNIPLSAISILLPLDRIIDRFRTMINIFGNMCGAIIVSHFASSKEILQPVEAANKGLNAQAP